MRCGRASKTIGAIAELIRHAHELDTLAAAHVDVVRRDADGSLDLIELV